MREELTGLLKSAIGDRTLNGFCAEAGINAGNLSRVLRGQKVSAEVLLRIAEHARGGVTAEELFYAAGYLGKRLQAARIPIYGTAAAGLPIAANEEIDGYVELDGLLWPANEYFALHVRGTSMDAANIPDGSIVVVHRQQTLLDGEIGVFLVEGEATVKKLAREKERVLLLPVSTVRTHKPQVYDKNTALSILGKVEKAIIDL
ncbi:hypothetical protein CE91St36_04980 [Christensenellaceae bacterium]|nr:hypothetical protein CE91St36_04980 [Christensenellaceae bacterium]BDF60349.1 hypothetical protein CE91St37_04990 [Christensenellaceae bacterium]